MKALEPLGRREKNTPARARFRAEGLHTKGKGMHTVTCLLGAAVRLALCKLL